MSTKNTKSLRNTEIYQKSLGIDGFEKKSYFQLALEYKITPQRIAYVVKRETLNRRFRKNGEPLEKGGALE